MCSDYIIRVFFIQNQSFNTGATDNMVNMWQLNSHELHSTMEGHTATITSVAISPNGLFAISGSEDKTARAWGLTLGLVVSVFTVSTAILSRAK